MGTTQIAGTITTEPLALNNGTLLQNSSLITAYVYEPESGDKVATVSGLSSDEQAVITITHTAIVRGMSYRVVLVTSDGEGLRTYKAG